MDPRTVDDLADVRTGDKGDLLVLSVFPRDAAAHELLRTHLTAAVVARHYCHPAAEQVRRTELPRIPALVFALPGLLEGGVTGSTHLDGHGKTLGYHLLTLSLPT